MQCPCSKGKVFLNYTSPLPRWTRILAWNAATWPASQSSEWILLTSRCGVCTLFPVPPCTIGCWLHLLYQEWVPLPHKTIPAWLWEWPLSGNSCRIPFLITLTGLQGDNAEQAQVPTPWKSLFFFFFSFTVKLLFVQSRLLLAIPSHTHSQYPGSTHPPPGCARKVSACSELSVHQSLQVSPLLPKRLCYHVLLKVTRGTLWPGGSICSPHVSGLAGGEPLVPDRSTELHPNHFLAPANRWEKQSIFCCSVTHLSLLRWLPPLSASLLEGPKRFCPSSSFAQGKQLVWNTRPKSDANTSQKNRTDPYFQVILVNANDDGSGGCGNDRVFNMWQLSTNSDKT